MRYAERVRFTFGFTVDRHGLSVLAMTILEERDKGGYPTSPRTYLIAGNDS